MRRLSIPNQIITTIPKLFLKDDFPIESKDKMCTIKEKENNTSTWKKYSGIVFILLSTLSMSLLALVTKLMPGYHPFMLTVWRYTGNTVPTIPILLYFQFIKKEDILEPIIPHSFSDGERIKNLIGIICRGILGGVVTICRFSALRYLNFADVSVITQATPAIVFIMARIFLGEKFSFIAIIAAVLSFLGIFTMTRPPLLTGQNSFETQTLIGIGLALGCLFSSSSTLIITRKLRKLNFAVLIFGFGIIGIIEGLSLSLATGVFNLPTSSKDIFLTVLITCLAFFGQVMSILATKFESAGILSVFKSSYVIYSLIWEITLLGVFPDYITWIGFTLVFTSLLLVGIRKCILSIPEENPNRQRFNILTK